MPEVQSTHSARRKALVPGLVATGVGPTAGGWRKVATVRRAVASLAMEPKVHGRGPKGTHGPIAKGPGESKGP